MTKILRKENDLKVIPVISVDEPIKPWIEHLGNSAKAVSDTLRKMCCYKLRSEFSLGIIKILLIIFYTLIRITFF